ncbi:hypothetical protein METBISCDRAFT_12095 [Metschnikowia bicuspidata]|uniref:Rab proteins geranylgeranyltransferase n=1 Tax=Metschnikowia bicuspidata TaxID=27322 RepID=A0A4P9ZIY5_9ASCO|nr:hypothetical protein METBISCDRAFT_12095 [Metschnikowia bicuspidata]
MPAFSRSERRKTMAERRPSASYIPPVIPQLSGLEKPNSHSLAMDQCDILILGTGLVESILAAALAWQDVNVLHIDRNSHYGDTCSTLTIDQLKKWCMEVNADRVAHFSDAQIYIPGGKRNNTFTSRDYGVDLSPRIMFAQLDFLALLVKSRVYKYLEFQSLSSFHVFENENFRSKLSNTTKEDIFTDQAILLQNKRALMKFLKFVLQDNADESKKELLLANSSTPIETFLKDNFRLESPQTDELVYSIGLCYTKDTRTPEALARIKRFLVSFDVYDSFPAMMLKYGGPGEISQGFCRSAAVADATYKLDTRLVDFDPQEKIAKFDDGSRIKINEKLVVSPTQTPKFLAKNYAELTEKLQTFTVSRLVTIVRNSCKEWIADKESAAIVVFPPGSLHTKNQYTVQVIIQNGGSGVCPEGELIWYLHTCEPNRSKAKEDLESAYTKMESSFIRDSEANLEEVLKESDFPVSNQGTPILVNSFKLGESMQNFLPKKTLDIVCKIGYVQTTYINPDLLNVLLNKKHTANISGLTVADSGDILFLNMPSSEVSYDGIVGEAKLLFQRITGSDEDFFDVDFEDDDEDYSQGVVSTVAAGDSELAVEDSDYDPSHHEPFGANEMEL